MIRIPVFSGKGVLRALEKIGYQSVRQRGSHVRMSCPKRKSVTVPNYPIISKGLLRKILRDAELTPEEFEKLL